MSSDFLIGNLMTGSEIGSSEGRFSVTATLSEAAKKLRAGLFDRLQAPVNLTAVEKLIGESFRTDAPRFEEISEYLFKTGGKRLRPILAILAAKACGLKGSEESIVTIGAGIELIHMATLLHDDIIDKSLLRRHHPSPLAVYGPDETLLCGDFLLTRAFGLAARLPRPVIQETERACVELTEGEILEVPLTAQVATEGQAIVIAQKKTSALFRLAAFSGAFLAGASEEVQRLFSTYAENLGIAFQILDDILDVTSDEKTLGKPLGTDIRERKPSLVNVLWLQQGSKLARGLTVLPKAETENSYVANALQELRSNTGPGAAAISASRSAAVNYAELSREALTLAAKKLNSSNRSEISDLLTLVEFTLDRLG